MASQLDYLNILEAMKEIPFPVGKKLLVDFLMGKKEEPITRNKLDQLDYFGSMHLYEVKEIYAMITFLLNRSFIQSVPLKNNNFARVLEITKKGIDELQNPSKKERSNNLEAYKTKITEDEKKVFESMDFYLSKYNDEQKKAIICDKQKILCIAGAGTGKTTALTKRIEFLTQFRSISPRKILAITFTRKAKQEMIDRLGNGPASTVFIETFNSFCEKQLNYYSDLVYGKKVRVIKYGERIKLFSQAIEEEGLDFDNALNLYFSKGQLRNKTKEELRFVFINDVFSIIDFFKTKKAEISVSFNKDLSQQDSAEMMINLAKRIDGKMKKLGLRDYSDQLIDCIGFFEQNPEYIPKYDHILVDEYQDINEAQIKLIEVLNSKNLFCVGDPRQSIFGWRGSDIRYILDFKKDYPDSEIVSFIKNYRSNKNIVELINRSIKGMGLPDLESANEKGNAKIVLDKAINENDEQIKVLEKIKESDYPNKEIFVLARTNRQLRELSNVLKEKAIQHVLKLDEQRKPVLAGENDVTLATVHAIKGLEADLVIIIGCNSVSFPCRASEHPIMDALKADYDKEEEERRLFYVAMSRAKKELYMTFSSALTPFFTEEMKKMIGMRESQTKLFKKNVKVSNGDVAEKIRVWRAELARRLGIPAYLIMHDTTLHEIAEVMPMSVADLEMIKGLGREKIRRYGEEILRIVNGG